MAPTAKTDSEMADCADATAPEPVVAAAKAPKRGAKTGTNKRTASERASSAGSTEGKPARRTKTKGELAFYQVQVPSDTPWNVLAIVGARDLDEARGKILSYTGAPHPLESLWAEKLTLSSEGVHGVGYGQSMYQAPGSRAGLHLFYAHGFQDDVDGEPGVATVVAPDFATAERLVMKDLSARQKAPLDLRISAVHLAEDTLIMLNDGYSANPGA